VSRSSIAVRVRCDEPGCETADEFWSHAGAGPEAHGWRRIDNKDYCPTHVAVKKAVHDSLEIVRKAMVGVFPLPTTDRRKSGKITRRTIRATSH
jgi:hypothetical protein